MDNGKISCFRMILDFCCSSFQLVGTYLIMAAAAQSIDGDGIIGRTTSLDCYLLKIMSS